MDEQSRLEALRESLWALDRQTRRAIGMDPTALLDRSQLTPEERELADRFASDGGQRPSEDRGATDVEDTRDPGASEAMDAGAGHDGDGGNGDDERSAFDVDGYGLRNRVGLVLGPLLFAAILLAPSPRGSRRPARPSARRPPGSRPGGSPRRSRSPRPPCYRSSSSRRPGPSTSTRRPLPMPTYIFLFMGGFFIAMAMQRWDLHRRIALRIIKAIGTSPSRIILGFMIATGFLSMWVSNTATTVMMTPIGLAVILQTRSLIEGSDTDIPTAQGEFNFGTGLMLCIAYSASIGGIATIIGTPPNLILVGAISETFGREISFAQWMLYGVPIAVVGIAIVWGYVVKAFIPPRMDSIPGGLDVIDEELQSLGPMNREEKLVFVVFVAAALAWISRSLVDPFAAIVTDDPIIAIGAALILFLLPSRQGDGSLAFLLDWDTAVEIPRGVLLLFGGGLTIANGFEETGLAEWIGGLLSAFQGVSIALVIGVIVVLTIFLTEVTSNTATTAMLMPILASLAVGLSLHPYAVMIGAATAASFAFMLPVATPPNAIVFGSGYITIPQMAKTGAGLNLIGIVLITLLTLSWLPLIWGIDVTRLPQWAGLLVGF